MAKTPSGASRKARAKADPNETKADKFKRLATARLQKICGQIDGLGNLSTAAYEYNKAQTEFIFKTIAERAEAAENRFKAGGKVESKSLVLPS